MLVTGSKYPMLLNFVDKSFDINRLIHYRLSIQICLNGFSFCIFDRTLDKHVVLRNYQYQKNIINYDDLGREISMLFTKDEFLSLNYPRCTCIYISTRHTLIPEEFFVKDNLRSYLEFICSLDELDEIHYHKFNQANIYSIFVIPSQVATKLLSHYRRISFINQSFPLIQTCLESNRENELFVNLHDGIMDVALLVNGEFKLHNVFEIYHLNDIVYYLNAIFHQFQLEGVNVPIFIAGDILREEIDELTVYFPKLEMNTNHRISALLGYENSYRYNNLLMAHKCE